MVNIDINKFIAKLSLNPEIGKLIKEALNEQGYAVENGTIVPADFSSEISDGEFFHHTETGEAYYVSGITKTNNGTPIYELTGCCHDIILPVTYNELRKRFRPWTLDYAKDGDVIYYVVEDEYKNLHPRVCLFKCVEDGVILAHASMSLDFGEPSRRLLILEYNVAARKVRLSTVKSIMPATRIISKEFMDEIASRGYIWDGALKQFIKKKETNAVSDTESIKETLSSIKDTIAKMSEQIDDISNRLPNI